MLNDKTREALEQLIGTVISSLPLILSSLRAGKEDFHIQNEPDYILGLVHGMVISGFLSSFSLSTGEDPTKKR
jgi:hypothetical protein